MNLWAVLLTGLFAGGVSCAAVQGGLLAGLVARQRDQSPAARSTTRVRTATAAGRARSTTRAAMSRPPAVDTRSSAPLPKPLATRLADDFAPVGGFLAGKLVSHTLLGALLGAVGSVVQLSVGIRAAAQLLAGALVITIALAQLGVRGFKNIVIEPPASWTRFVRGRARSQSAIAPTLLGLATVLIPCGVTLSVEALALASGSPWAGAATMAVFVAGTSPLFAALGYVARKAATAWRGRLSMATGLVVLGVGMYTLNGGLTLINSPLAANHLAQTLGFSAPPATAETVTIDTGASPTPGASSIPAANAGIQTAVLAATTGRYSPANIQVKAGLPTILIVRSKNAEGCIRAFVIRDKQYILPKNGDTRIDLGPLQPGTLDFACGMGMYTGQLTIV